jgi:hypothetical protein
MPSRRAAAFILAFWLAVTGYVAYRDLWPVLFASGPPPVAIDLADEASQNVPIHWVVNWNGKPVGKLVTQMRYVEADDTFRFTTTYRQLRLEMSGVTVVVPEFTSAVRVTRDGDLREQSADGKLELELHGTKVGDLTAKLAGTVTGGQLVATVDASLDAGGGLFRRRLSRTLDPVPVRQGQPLNPLLPVNRLRGVTPGRPRWVVEENDPFKEVVRLVKRELNLPLPDEHNGPLIGDVLSASQDLQWHNESVACWVIEYRRDDEVQVRTWLRTSDGKVLKQEAFAKGDTMTIVRDE